MGGGVAAPFKKGIRTAPNPPPTTRACAPTTQQHMSFLHVCFPQNNETHIRGHEDANTQVRRAQATAARLSPHFVPVSVQLYPPRGQRQTITHHIRLNLVQADPSPHKRHIHNLSHTQPAPWRLRPPGGFGRNDERLRLILH